MFLAVVRERTLAAAGRTLGVDPSTVSRRLTALERGLGVQLFERHGGIYRLNEAGREFEVHAQRMEDAAVELGLRLGGRDRLPRGEVRITSPQQLSPILMGALRQLRQRYPELVCTLVFSDHLIDIQRHQADVALRLTAKPPATLVGRRVARYGWAAYVSADYAARLRQGDEGHFIGVPDVSNTERPPWAAAVAPRARLGLVVDGLVPTAVAVQQGLGIARLPVHLGDRWPALVRLGEVFFDPSELPYSLWILTHERLRNAGRVRAVVDLLWEVLSAQRSLFEGSG